MTTKTYMIKGTAKRLIDTHPNLWNMDFDDNKKNVSKVTNITDKKIRNEIAGYIIRLKKRKYGDR